MTRTRLIRQLAALAAVAGMLFSQFALAAYNCPMERMAVAEVTTEAEECMASDSATASLCHEHCKDSQLAVPDAQPDIAGFAPAFTATVPLANLAAPSCEYSQAVLTHATSPPLSILNCCFRI